MTLTPEQIAENYDRFAGFLQKTGDRAEPLAAMLEVIGERLAIAPASSREHFHCSFPGGLVDHSLRVLGNVLKLNKTFEWNLPKPGMIIGALLHDLGKVGNENEDLYLPQMDNYKREKYGSNYEYSVSIPYMPVPQRSLYLLQHFGVKLTHDETLCLLLNDGWVVEENRQYCLKVSPLVFAVQTADYISTMSEKQVSLGF